MKIIYVVRRDKEYHEKGTVSQALLKHFPINEIIETWNKIFNINWHQFRFLLNELRENNAKDLKFDEQYYFYELQKINISDCIVVPVDDDDWLHPNLFTILRDVPKQDVYRWNYAEAIPNNYYNTPISSTPPFHNNKLSIYPHINYPKFFFYYQTNNYAVYAPQNLNTINCHYEADCELPKTINNIDKCLSIHHLHLCSISFLSHYIKQKASIRKLLPHLLEIYQNPFTLPNDTPEYFIPYFEELTKIYKRLSIKRTLFI